MILATTEIKAEKKTAMFSASRISELLAGGEGKTQCREVPKMTLLEAMYEEIYGISLKDEPEEVRTIVIEIWNLALKAVNRQIIYISHEENV